MMITHTSCLSDMHSLSHSQSPAAKASVGVQPDTRSGCLSVFHLSVHFFLPTEMLLELEWSL